MNGISFSGLASGIDTGSIVTQLLQLERIPIQQIESRKAGEQQKIDLLGTLRGYVEDLRDKAKSLSSLSGFLHFQAEASIDGVANFTTSENAVQGSHTLDVIQLAAADRWAFAGVADPTADLGGGSVSFTVAGTSYDVALTAGNASLQAIAAAINDQAAEAVTASVVNTGTGANPSYRLVVASNETGIDNAITGIASSFAGLTIDSTVGGPDNVAVGSNAIARVDGLLVERSTNEFSGVVEGVSFEAIATTDGLPISFSVSADVEAVRQGVQEFIDAYNRIVDFANTQNTYSEDGGAGGALFGDSVLRSVSGAIRGALFNVDLAAVAADQEGFSTLSLIGISLDRTGRLSLDSTKFDAKLSENLSALADLFVDTDGFDNGGAAENTPEYGIDTTADRGLFDILVRSLDSLLKDTGDGSGGTVKSLFNSRTDRLNETIKRYDSQIEQRERYIDDYEQSLIRRFAALEQLLGNLNAQGASLSGYFTSLQNQR